MSVVGGKAGIKIQGGKCPLLTQSGLEWSVSKSTTIGALMAAMVPAEPEPTIRMSVETDVVETVIVQAARFERALPNIISTASDAC